jgi:2Fe-2S ferredoxin
MTKIIFIEHNGTARNVEVEDGQTLMNVAVEHLIPGIDADCGGACACATCHIHIDPEWIGRLPAISETERSMLDLAEGVGEHSRLACQIQVSPSLDGIIVHTPEGQH